MISCRNLLIYLGVNLQKRLASIFHYSLRPGGYLFLGPSESIGEHTELFGPVDARNRIWRKKRGAVRSRLCSAAAPLPGRIVSVDPEQPNGTDIGAIIRPIVLAEFAPPHAVVDADFQCLYFSAQIGRFLQPAEGPFQNNLLMMVYPGLRVPLRAALHEARRSGRPAVRDHLSLRLDQTVLPVRLTVRPIELREQAGGAFLVAFQEEGCALPPAGETESKDQAQTLVEQLERELSSTRGDLNITIQELEAANEELKSSNEELLSMNEELHSANEELEASKEEVQRAFDALAVAKDDLENLYASTQIATIFLDHRHGIQSFTPAVAAIYSLLDVDIGRKLTGITHRAVSMPPLPSLADTLTAPGPIEHEVRTSDGRRFLRRVLPYRTREAKATGLVVTFVDVTELRESEERHREIIQGALDCVITMDSDGRVVDFNPAAEATFNLTAEAAAGKLLGDLILPERFRRAHAEGIRRFLETGEGPLLNRRIEMPALRSDGSEFPVELTISVIPGQRRAGAALFNAFLRDISERKHAEEALLQTTGRLSAIINTAVDGIVTIDERGVIESVNPAAVRLFGYSASEMIGQNVKMLMPEPFHGEHDGYLANYLRTGERKIIGIGREVVGKRKDGSTFPMDLAVSETRLGERRLFTGIVRDVSERTRAEQDRASLAAIVSSSDDAIVSKNLQGIVQTWNAGAERLFGYRAEEIVGKSIRMLIPPERQAEEDDILARLSRGERVEHYETVRVTKDGRRVNVALTVSPIRNATGEVVAASKIARDVTQRKLAQERLRQSEERYRKIFQSAYVSIWQEDFSAVKALIDRLSAEGVTDFRAYFRGQPARVEEALSLVRVRDVNEATLAMFEAADASELRQSLDNVFLPETRGIFIEELVAIGEGRLVVSGETRLRTLRGRPMDVVLSVSFPSAPGDWSSVLVSLMDVTERRQAEQALRESQERLRIAVENAPLVLFHCDRNLRYTWFANQPHPDYPLEQLLGRTPGEVLGEAGEPVMETMRRVLATGRGEHLEFSLNTSLGRQTWDVTLEPLRNITDGIIGIAGCALEITERKQAEERQQLLLAELSHRVKNTLATVQSVAMQTALHAQSMPEFRKTFEARLHSLAQTHSLLTRGRWRGAELRAIVAGEMGAHGGVEAGRVTLNGPTINLTPKVALSLHLVLHELATNAAKYGALSIASGSVEIGWSINEEAGNRFLRLVWKESGGPPVVPPARRGFGTTVIENSVDYELDGQTVMQYLAEGLRCEFRIPWSEETGFVSLTREGRS